MNSSLASVGAGDTSYGLKTNQGMAPNRQKSGGDYGQNPTGKKPKTGLNLNNDNDVSGFGLSSEQDPSHRQVDSGLNQMTEEEKIPQSNSKFRLGDEGNDFDDGFGHTGDNLISRAREERPSEPVALPKKEDVKVPGIAMKPKFNPFGGNKMKGNLGLAMEAR